MNINKEFLKKHWVLILLGLILLLGFAIRIYYYANTSEQTLWWDEGDYMVFAKKLAGQGLKDYSYKDIWSPRRPFLFPAIAGSVLLMGFGEAGVRFLQVLISMFGILLTYLLGKELFGRKIGLIAAFLMSIFWMNIFYTMRLLVDVPSAVLGLATIYFFWLGYVKQKNKRFIWLAGLFFGLGLMTRHATVLTAVPMLAVVVMKEKLGFLKNRNLWTAGIIAVAVLIPFFIYLFANYANPIQAGTGFGQGRFATIHWGTLGAIWNYIAFFPAYLGWVFLALFLIGCLKFFDVVFGYDQIFKNAEIQKYVMLLLWIASYILFFGYQGGLIGETMPMQERYLMAIFPAVFMILGAGLIKVYSVCKKYGKAVAISAVLILMILGSYYQIHQGNLAIFGKLESYKPVKDSALWMKERINFQEAIITNSVPQTRYYTETRADYFDTEEDYAKYIKEHKPRFYVVSVFERSGEYFYKFPEVHKLMPVQAYFADAQKTQPLLIVYEFPENSNR